jgi:hypothetical protein
MNKIFRFDNKPEISAKIHYRNPITKKSFCRRANATWADAENISGGNNITTNKDAVTCKFCLKYKDILW